MQKPAFRDLCEYSSETDETNARQLCPELSVYWVQNTFRNRMSCRRHIAKTIDIMKREFPREPLMVKVAATGGWR